MNLLQGSFVFIMFLIMSACVNDAPSVLVGLEVIGKNQRTGEDYVSEHDRIVVFSQDSIEIIPLWQGCILSPAGKKKFKLYKNKDLSNYVIVDGDTIKVNYDYLGDNVFSTCVNKSEFRYLSAVDVSLNVEHFELIDMIEGNSFHFLIDNLNYFISFYEEEVCVVNRETKEAKYINIGHWFIEQSGSYFFLIIDDNEEIFKFQVSDFSSDDINVYNLNNKKREEITFVKLTGNYSSFKSGVWTSDTLEVTFDSEQNFRSTNSFSESWLLRYNKFIVHDTSTIFNLQPDSDASVYIDWKSSAIINDYSVIFSFDIDVLDKKKIKVYPIDEYGKVNKRFSKIYYLN